MGDAFGRRVRPVRDRESVVDVIIAQSGHRLGQLGIVLLLAVVEARVLEHPDIARKHRRDRPLRLRPGAILDEAHRPARQAMERQHQLRGRHVGPDLAPGPPQMRQQEHDRAAVAKLEHGREHGLEPRVVGHARAVHRHVQIDADEHALAGQILREVIEGLESHGVSTRISSPTATAPPRSTRARAPARQSEVSAARRPG